MTMATPHTPLTVAISGSSGLIGSALTQALLDRGDHVIALVRPGSEPTATSLAQEDLGGLTRGSWDPARGMVEQAEIDRADVVVNLAGASIGAKRWNDAYRTKILTSRTAATSTLAQAISASPTPPSCFISGSASGFYGPTTGPVTEDSPAGTTFLAGVCEQWERAALAADSSRVVLARTATVMTAKGGALEQVLRPMRLGAGATLGSGRQLWSWISLTDHVRALLFLMDTPDVVGPVNLVSPAAASNTAITAALAKALRRPAFLKVPAPALRLLLGGFADEILMSQDVRPGVLDRYGFEFAQPDHLTLATAVAAELGVKN